MEGTATAHPRRLLRVLLAGGVLALGWAALDIAVNSTSASAAETADFVPLTDGVDAGAVSDILTPVLDQVVTPVLGTVVAPVTTPILTAVAPVSTPVLHTVEGLVSPVLEPVTEPLAPVVAPLLPVVAPVLEAVSPVLEPLTVVDSVIPGVLPIATLAPNGTILAAGGAVLLTGVLAATLVPLLPAPDNRAPFKLPLAPAAPGGSAGSTTVGFYGELNSGLPAGLGATGTAMAQADELPSSPTFASDTTPD